MMAHTRPHARNFVKWAKDKPEVIVLSADLTGSCEVDDFQQAYPDRFFSMGMAKQNMMGFSAGLAREGFFPYIPQPGMSLDRVHEMRDVYGRDVIFLIGGGLQRHSPDLVENCKHFLRLVEAKW